MTSALIDLGLFTAKSMILVFFILLILIAFFMLLAKSKEKQTGKLTIKNLNEQYEETKQAILQETLTKKELKQYLKDKKEKEKEKQKENQHKKIYVLNFNGDIKATAVSALSEEITAILNVAKPHDEVVLRLESPGGVVHGYGLAASQLLRLRDKNIHLTIAIDKIAASGGYMMACVANQIIAAPFAIIGSIGVIIQLPNFNRVLKDKHIDFEQHTAGNFKRTITVFGENTEEGRNKLKSELEEIHHQFKDLIVKHRTKVDIEKIATGEHWLGEQALKLNLVDHIQTSDDYLLAHSHTATLFEVSYQTKKPFLARLTSTAHNFRDSLLYLFTR